MKRSPVGRADLVELLQTLDATAGDRVANLLGFEARPPAPAVAASGPDAPPGSGQRADSEHQAPLPRLPPLDVPFLCPIELAVLEPLAAIPVPPGQDLSTSAAV